MAEEKGCKAKADNFTTEAKGGKAREANFTMETGNGETEVDETKDRSDAETREGTIEVTTKNTTMITEQGEMPRNEIKMIVSQTTEAGIQTSMTGQGTDDQSENYRGCTNWREQHYWDDNTDCWDVGEQIDPIELDGKRKSIVVQNIRCENDSRRWYERWQVEGGGSTTNWRHQWTITQ